MAGPISVDRLTDAVLKSTRVFLESHLVGRGLPYSGVHIASPDFEHDETPDKKPRRLPYVTIVLGHDETRPWEIGNRRVERTIEFDVWVVCESFEQALRRPHQVQQLIITSEVDGVTGGIPLVDFDSPGRPTVGFVEIDTGVIAPLVDIDAKEKWRALKYTGVVMCRVVREKERGAALLE